MRNKVQLISYVDRFGGGDLAEFHRCLDEYFGGLFGGTHLLPFYTPIDGEDAGFDPSDHTRVDPRLGQWQDVSEIGEHYDLMTDMIVNHVSADSPRFHDYLKKGDASPYANMFLRMRSVFPDGVSEEILLDIYRPRPGLPFSVYNFEDGRRGLFWTTFTKNQIDIDVNHAQGWQYLMDILDRFHESRVKCIRLDATGYAIKKAGTSCFMLPETFEFIDRLKGEAHNRGIKVLVEIHSHHQTQIDIAAHSDYVYDFALPPLVLHTLISKDAVPLQNWLKISPRNAITVLDTHDGIGIIDAGPSAWGANDGLLTPKQIDGLVEAIHENSQGNSRKATGAAASNVDLYQVNCTFLNALGGDENLYLIARLLQFFAPGIPQVYYVGLLAGENDMALLEKTGIGRDINRAYFSKAEVSAQAEKPVVRHLCNLIRFRNEVEAFNGDFSLGDSGDKTLEMCYSRENDSVILKLELESLKFEVTHKKGGQLRQIRNWNEF